MEVGFVEPATNAACTSEGVVADDLWWGVKEAVKAVKAGLEGDVEELASDSGSDMGTHDDAHDTCQTGGQSEPEVQRSEDWVVVPPPADGSA